MVSRQGSRYHSKIRRKWQLLFLVIGCGAVGLLMWHNLLAEDKPPMFNVPAREEEPEQAPLKQQPPQSEQIVDVLAPNIDEIQTDPEEPPPAPAPPAVAESDPKPAKSNPKPEKRLCSSAIGTLQAKGVSHDVDGFTFGHEFTETDGWTHSVVYEYDGTSAEEQAWKQELESQTSVTQSAVEREECARGEPSLDGSTVTPPPLVGDLSLEEVVTVSQTLEMEQINKLHPNVQPGGSWAPDGLAEAGGCPKVAIIIPYRNRWTHLKVLLNHLHALLQRQRISYRIFLAEQYGPNKFSRGVVSNAAFVSVMKNLHLGVDGDTHDGERELAHELQAQEYFDCIIFQDVDLLPENDRHLYNCESDSRGPKHFAVAMDKFDYKMPYNRYFGGVLAFTPEHFLKVNGYANTYWGWGGEDDDLYFRTEAVGLTVNRKPVEIARFKMLDHSDDKRLPNQYTCDLLRTARTRYPQDGLSTCKFRLLSVDQEPLYTRLLIDVGLPDWVHYPNDSE